MSKKLLITALLALNLAFLASPAHAQEVYEDRQDWKQYFDEGTSDGTILIYNRNKNSWMVYNVERALRKFAPASTYKMITALIAIDNGKIKDVDRDIIKWDKVEREFGEWNADMNLRTAMKLSATPVFHQLDKQSGWEKDKKYLSELNFGYVDLMDDAHDDMWLEKNIKINCFEYLDFLRRLNGGETMFSSSTVDELKDIITIDSGDNFTLRGKTGWARDKDQEVGWFVGWLEINDLEKGDNVLYFAMNMDIKNATYLRYRKQIVKQIFSDISTAKFEQQRAF